MDGGPGSSLASFSARPGDAGGCFRLAGVRLRDNPADGESGFAEARRAGARRRGAGGRHAETPAGTRTPAICSWHQARRRLPALQRAYGKWVPFPQALCRDEDLQRASASTWGPPDHLMIFLQARQRILQLGDVQRKIRRVSTRRHPATGWRALSMWLASTPGILDRANAADHNVRDLELRYVRHTAPVTSTPGTA